MWGNSTLLNLLKKYGEKIILTESVEKIFLIDLLTTNNGIYRDSLTLTKFSYFSPSEFSECFDSLST